MVRNVKLVKDPMYIIALSYIHKCLLVHGNMMGHVRNLKDTYHEITYKKKFVKLVGYIKWVDHRNHTIFVLELWD